MLALLCMGVCRVRGLEGKGGAMVFAACILSFKKLIIKYKENLKKISL